MPISINVSERAAQKRGKLPLGWYHMRICGVELQESRSEKNPGKPIYNFEFEITDDPRNPQDENGASEFAGRPEWIRACIWDGAEYTIVGLLNALGHDVKPGRLEVPDILDPDCSMGGIDAFLGKEVMCHWGIKKKEKIEAAKEGRKPDPEWLGFRPASEDDEESPVAAIKPVGRRRALA